MPPQKRKLLEKILGSAPRELVRIGFTIWAVRIFLHAAPKTAADCQSTVFGIQTNATQVFAVILVLGVGLGAALVMKLGEKYLQKNAS